MKKIRAFTLASAVIGVLITGLCMLSLQLIVNSVMTAKTYKVASNEIGISYVQIKNYLADKGAKYYNEKLSNSSHVAIATDKKLKHNYIIERYYSNSSQQTMIRIREAGNGGHMPVLMNLRKVSFAGSETGVMINVTENNRKQSQLYFELEQLPQEKTESQRTLE